TSSRVLLIAFAPSTAFEVSARFLPLLRCSPSPFLRFLCLSGPWSFLNQVRMHPFQDGFASLILHPRRQSQESNVRFGHHFTDFQFGRDRIPDEDRLEKAGRP